MKKKSTFYAIALLLGLMLFAHTIQAQITIYTASLSGPAESPPVASLGTGTATITINTALNTMRVQCTFSGLTGTTTASHIHAATSVANTGTAGVATQTPSFSGFPLGVTSGSYDQTFDMTLASSYNAAYITANGGTVAAAFAALKAAADAGKAYFNIHTSAFSGGEIRGFLTNVCPFSGTAYVNASVASSGDGTTWATAFKTLQEALTAANTCANITQIWVAKGTYYPDEGGSFANNNRIARFTMKNNLAIYGGFSGNGNEIMLSERNWTTNPTILSGDIDQNDGANFANYGGNSLHVIYNLNNGLNSTAILDGFTITGGHANGGGTDNLGGGMYNSGSSPSITNCSFSGNLAKTDAGDGGGMYNSSSSPSLVNCSFSGNQAYHGGGMVNYASSPSLTNCSFSGNQAAEGGGMYNENLSSPSVTNCSFSGNVAYHGVGGGGGMYSAYSAPILTNCSFSGNQATNGGGMLNVSASALVSPSLKNCILWSNSSEVGNVSNSSPTYTNTLVKGLVAGGFQGTEDPLFVNQPPVGLGTTGNLRLQACSPAINAGNDADNATTTDLAGNNRKFGQIDLGAYEFQGNPATGTRLYVNATAPANGDGTTWASAYQDLQVALAMARTCSNITEIWVAKGTYYPDEGGSFANNDRNAAFTMKNGLAIYGGFSGNGNENSLSQRNWATNPTTLSGEIQQDNDVSNNSYHVIFNNFTSGNTLTNTAILDGFIITGGNANSSDPHNTGGGMYNYYSSPTVTNCRFTGNQTGVYGYGAGMGNYYYSSPIVTNCAFVNNDATYGGGVDNYAYSGPTFKNCIFSGNYASQGGGMVNRSTISSPILINCTFSGNNAYQGGGLYNAYCNPILKNCISWGNSDEVYNDNATPDYTYCLIQGQSPPGIANLDGTNPANNPLFVSQPNFNAAPAAAGDLRLRPCSPAINRGNDADNNTSTDLAGNPRLVSTIDLGAYELQSTTSNLTFYVKTNGDDTKDGQSWDNAFKTLQKALQFACSGDQVWVAQGTYYPDEGAGYTNNSRSVSFNLKEGVKIYGGFSGNETQLGGRNWATNVTIVSGDIDQNDGNNLANTSGNSYHVVRGGGSQAVFDGFTVQGGNANVPANMNNQNNEDVGGGMYIGGNLTVSNCSILGNQAITGGGIFNASSGYTLINCIVSGNKANNGGGMYHVGTNPHPTIINCTISGNQATNGGGIYNSSSNPSLKNCILWGNSSEIANISSSNPTYANTLIKGMAAGGFNGTEDPLFLLQPNFSSAPTTAGNLRLPACSPVLNLGNNADNSTTLDLGSSNRKFGVIDLGAYEYQGNAVTQPTANASTTTAVACAGNTINLSATGGNNFSWAGPNGSNFSSTAQNPSFTGSSTSYSGLYTVTVSNANCPLTATATVSVVVNPLPVVSISPATSQVCVGQSLALSTNASGAGYSWVSSGGTFSSTTNQATFSGNSAGGYSFTVTVSNGTCTNTATASVTVNPGPNISTQPLSQTLSELVNLTLTVVAANATVYQWQKDNTNFGSSSASPSLNLGPATLGMSGTYKVIVSGACGSATSSPAIVTVTPSVSFATSNGPAVCIGLVIDLKCQNVGTSYTWLGPDGWTSNLKNPSRGSATAAMGGVYSVSVKSGSLVTSATVSVQLVAKNAVSANSNSPITVGNAIQLSANGGLAFSKTYAWTGPSSFSSTLQNPTRPNAQLTHKGKYIVTFNGACGTATASTSVVVNTATRIASAEDDAIDMEISAYPNPVTNTLTVEIRLAKPAALTLELLNGIGQKNGQWKLPEESTHHKTELDLSTLTGGMYLLQAQAGKQKVVKRVVKIQY